MDCGSYRLIKLLEVMESIFENQTIQQVHISDMEFGFVPGKGTTDAIFVVIQIQEDLRAKSKKLDFRFVDMVMAFDRVPREVSSWAMRKLGVEECLMCCLCIRVLVQ